MTSYLPTRTSPSDPWRLRNPSTGELVHDPATCAPLGFATRDAALAWVPEPVPVMTPEVFPAREPDPAHTAAALSAEISQEIVPTAAAPGSGILTARQAEVAATMRAARSPRTLKAYAHFWGVFEAWCAAEPRDPYSGATTVAEFLRDVVSGRVPDHRATSVQTVNVMLAGITAAYEDHGCAAPNGDPGFRVFLRGLRREIGVAPKRQSTPVTEVELRAILKRIPSDLVGIRDRALLLVGWAGCMRRSEITGLEIRDVAEEHAGLVVRLRRSKTDQEGRGSVKVIPRSRLRDFCPVAALQAWLTASGITEGYVFRGIDPNTSAARHGRMAGWTVASIVKRRIEDAGMDPAKFSGHSLRAGFLTAAARMGASERSMMNQSGHRRSETLRGYIRDADLWTDNAATVVVDGLGK